MPCRIYHLNIENRILLPEFYLSFKLHSYSLVLIISVLCGGLFAEDYRIYFLGFPIVNVSMESSNNALSLHTETLGMIHSFWPVDNHYFTHYDSVSFGIRQYTKSIHQGSYKGELNCTFEPNGSQLNYNSQSVAVADSIQNIFTLLARVSYQSVEYLDTKWYPMNHEGASYRARFLWAGTETVEINDADIVCDHYRLDIEEVDGVSINISPWDYFTDHVASNEALRQIWVEQNDKRRIIKATVSIYGITITAKLLE